MQQHSGTHGFAGARQEEALQGSPTGSGTARAPGAPPTHHGHPSKAPTAAQGAPRQPGPAEGPTGQRQAGAGRERRQGRAGRGGRRGQGEEVGEGRERRQGRAGRGGRSGQREAGEAGEAGSPAGRGPRCPRYPRRGSGTHGPQAPTPLGSRPGPRAHGKCGGRAPSPSMPAGKRASRPPAAPRLSHAGGEGSLRLANLVRKRLISEKSE